MRRSRITNREKLAILSPIVLIATMYPVFQLLSRAFAEPVIGWYVGLVLYWLTWCTVFPLLLVGKKSIITMIRPQKLNLKVAALVLFPLIMASLYKLVPGMGYRKASLWLLLLYISTSFGNGFFEEVLWRGVYMELFTQSILFRIIWPSIWFALWHYAPGSVSANANVWGLMIGSGLFGFYLSFLAKKTGAIWWSIVAHTLGGIIMIL
jgi:membrane protease YdiL (CAAX protease family)